MDQEQLGEMVRENLRLTQENYKLLRKIRRAGQLQVLGTILFYAVMIGVPLFVYRYYLEDYVNDARKTYEQLQQGIGDLKEIPAAALSTMLRGRSE